MNRALILALLLVQLGARTENATTTGKLKLIDGRDASGIRVARILKWGDSLRIL
jgi:hypothetical protein